MNRALLVGATAGVGIGLGVAAAVFVGRRESREEAPRRREDPRGSNTPTEPGEACAAALERRGEAGGVVYRSYTPSTPGPRPVILMHGRGGSEDLMFDALADVVLPAVQIYPRGSQRLGKHYAWAQERSKDAAWSEAQAEAVRRMRPFLQWVYDCLGAPVVAGHSQGAHMAFGLAAAYPELVHAAVGASGALTPALWGPLSVPVTAVHGVDDGVVSISGARRMRAELGVELVEVEGHGHALGGALEKAFGDALRRHL